MRALAAPSPITRQTVRAPPATLPYASACEKLDVSEWNYGYPFHPTWGATDGPPPALTTYLDASIVIDVLRSDDRGLLWRGEGRA
jgi:hypothetical protein